MASKYVFNKRCADAAVDFFPRFLCFVEGEWAGKPFTLSPWEEEHTRQIFGWRRRKDGRRRYRRVRGWIPRKNAKSTWAAGIGHLMTVGDNEPGAQTYSHALDKSQASVVFDIASRMVGQSPALSNLYEITKTSLFCPANMAVFRALSGEAYGKHGLSPSCNIGDEAHAWRNAQLHTFLVQGMGARRQPLDLTISTAGEIKTYGFDLYQNSKAILEKPSFDPECYVFIYEADDDDDWTDPDVWARANPNLNISIKREFLISECKRARQSARLENDFKRYHLNLWVEQARRWFPMHRWHDNTEAPSKLDLWKELPARMRQSGRPAFCGLDLGNVSDITAAVWVFPPDSADGRVTLMPRFWVPEQIVAERDSPRTPYKSWVASGALQTTPGNVTDYDYIEHVVVEDSIAFGCKGLAYDPWNATQVAIHLQSEGLPCVEFRQGYRSMAAPSKEIERLFTSGQLEHGNHPVLMWMFQNAAYKKDPAGNIKPDKERAAEKIDGVVASVMGIGLMTGKIEPQLDVRAMIA
jgi:phage terminase large subunit-like protein